MAKSVLDELEELLFNADQGEIYYRAKARSARVRGNLPILEPNQSGSKFKGFGQNPTDPNARKKPTTKPTGEAAQLDSFTLSLPPSSTIQTATYYPKKQYLTVSFKSGSTYSYDDVPFKVIMAWRLAPSAGSFFYYKIRTIYDYRKI